MTESQPDPDRPRGLRARLNTDWKIPSRVFGRVRTSTVLLCICFVLTALLYNQLRPEPQLPQQGPVPVDTTLDEPTQAPTRTYQERTTTAPPSATSSVQPSEPDQVSPSDTSEQDSGSAPPSTTQRTIVPGVPLPPQLESLLPTAPGSPSGTR